jgi:heat-inducible transcriptional repressor
LCSPQTRGADPAYRVRAARPDRALVVLVFADGHVENRVFSPPLGQTPSSMREASNFLNALAEGRTIGELRAVMEIEVARRRQELTRLPIR